MTRGSITFLGTGTAFHHDGRGSHSLFVRPPQGSPFLVDAAPTMMAAATRFRVDCEPVDRLFVTHLHGDHVAGWPFLFLHLVFLHGRTRPFDVFGPDGTRDTLQGLLRLCYPELVDRGRFELRYHEIPVRETSDIAAGPGLRLDVVPVRHRPSSIGLRFHMAGVDEPVVSVSGDTGWCDGLERLAAGSDLLVLECTSVQPGIEGHLSLREIRERSEALGAARIALVHLPDEVAEQLGIDPIPRVLAAHDGLELVFSR